VQFDTVSGGLGWTLAD